MPRFRPPWVDRPFDISLRDGQWRTASQNVYRKKPKDALDIYLYALHLRRIH